MKNLKEIFQSFFKELNYATHYVSEIENLNIKINKISQVNQIPFSKVSDNIFFPEKIKDDIQDNSNFLISFKSKILEKIIFLNFIVFDEEISEKILNKYIRYAKKIFIWFYFIQNYSIGNQCSDQVNVFIYFTNFKKVFPSNQIFSLDTIHINTGFAHVCRKDKTTDIVIFREEEWYKVLLHETFHNFGLDFSAMSYNVDNKLGKLFNVNVEYNFFECYCETWARILNCVITTHLSYQNNIDKLFSLLNREKYFSIYQACKILDFFDLTYDLISVKNENNIVTCRHLYKENTSVFTYFILTSIFMFNYSDFINWCLENNLSIFNFEKTNQNIDSFYSLLKSLYRKKPFLICNKREILLDKLQIDNEFLKLHSLRMSITE